MKAVSLPRLALAAGMVLALGLSGISGWAAAGRDAAAQIGAEIDRLERAVRDKPLADPAWQEARPELESTLARARASVQAGRPYWGLLELEQARTTLRALETLKTPGARQGGLPGFEAAWKQASAELAALDAVAQASARATAPAAFRAQAESAAGQTMVLLQASRSYARVTGPGAGYYYLGQARAAAESARFCSSLPPPRAAAPMSPASLRSVAPEIGALRERAVAAFKPPRSIERHSDFIVLNATLKLAGELDQARLYAGALEQYLDALLQLGRLDRAATDAREQARLRAALARERTRLRGSPEDDSIAELFVERALALLARRPGADEWKTVAVIVEQVLPAYGASRKAAPPPNRLAARPVTVTLVRWPYT